MEKIYKELGQRIRQLRQKKGWSQEELADMSNIHRSHVGEIERGETAMMLSTLRQIGATLKVPMADLLKGM